VIALALPLASEQELGQVNKNWAEAIVDFVHLGCWRIHLSERWQVLRSTVILGSKTITCQLQEGYMNGEGKKENTEEFEELNCIALYSSNL